MDTLEALSIEDASEDAYDAFRAAEEALDDLCEALVSVLCPDRAPDLDAAVKSSEIVTAIFLLGYRAAGERSIR